MLMLWCLFSIVSIVILLWARVSLILFSLTLIVLGILFNFLPHSSFVPQVFLWTVLLTFLMVFNIYPLRRWLFSRHIFVFYKKVMPKFSRTEREALKVGDIGFEGEIFRGAPNFEKLCKSEKIELTPNEQKFLDGPVKTLCSMINDWEINHRAFEIPQPIWEFLKAEGFFGLIISKEYGGKEFSALAHSQIIYKIASVSIAVATVVSVPNSLGPGKLLLQYGTCAQKQFFLPKLAQGHEIPCFALTSEVAGSDAASIEDSGIIERQTVEGQDSLVIRLNWKKRYITLAPVATLIGLAFKLYDPNRLIGTEEYLGITCALIPASIPGISIGRHHLPLGSAFPNGPIQGKDVIIPFDHIIGGKDMAGQGWRMLMESLIEGRSISLPAMVGGSVGRLVSATRVYAQIREQFGRSIVEFGGVTTAFARLAGLSYLMEALRLFTVTALDKGIKSAVGSAITKCHSTQMSRLVVCDAMDIHGGKGICMGPHNYLAQAYFETPISITVEGANILTRSMIIFGQGAIRSHPYLLREILAVESLEVEKSLKSFDRIFFKHVGFVLSNTVRTILLGWSRGFRDNKNNNLKKYIKKFSHSAVRFTWLADISMALLGKNLKQAEELSARLGDILSFLYMAAAIIQYQSQTPPEGFTLFRWGCDELLYQIEERFILFCKNLPTPWVGKVLIWLLFPFGRKYTPPTDALNRTVTEFLQSNQAKFLYQTIYADDVSTNPIGRMDSVLKKVMVVKPLAIRVKKAVRAGIIMAPTFEEKINQAFKHNILTQAEASQLLEAEQARREVIQVDDFSKEDAWW